MKPAGPNLTTFGGGESNTQFNNTNTEPNLNTTNTFSNRENDNNTKIQYSQDFEILGVDESQNIPMFSMQNTSQSRISQITSQVPSQALTQNSTKRITNLTAYNKKPQGQQAKQNEVGYFKDDPQQFYKETQEIAEANRRQMSITSRSDSKSQNWRTQVNRYKEDSKCGKKRKQDNLSKGRYAK